MQHEGVRNSRMGPYRTLSVTITNIFVQWPGEDVILGCRAMQVARMIMLIALSFWLCWTPFYAVTAITQLQTHSFLHESQFLFTMLATHWAGFLNSCLNPLIYAALSNNFRRGFKQVRYVIPTVTVSCSWYYSVLIRMRIILCHVTLQNYTVSQKSIPDIFNFNLKINYLILIIFGRNIFTQLAIK